MLGNWSFGDYFKQGAIEMVWELLTKVWKLDPERLHVSCFEGDEKKNGVPRDTEAADIWKKVAGLPDDHIHYFGKDNFWEMGDNRPLRARARKSTTTAPPDKSGRPAGETAMTRASWKSGTTVFIQYNRNADRSLTVLPAPARRYRHGFSSASARCCRTRDRITTSICGTRSGRS